MLRDPERLLVTVLVVTNLMNIVAIALITQEAVRYLVLVNETAGPQWLTAALFRFGASSLLNDLLAQRHKLRTGAYDSADYVSI